MRKEVTLALGIIAKDEHEQLVRIIDNYQKYFDEIVIAIDDQKCLDTIHALYPGLKKLHLVKYEWRDDFSHKRNFLEEHVKSDYYLRLDCDDAIVNPEQIRVVAQRAKDEGIYIVYCYYLYAKDEHGNCIAAHWRETLIKVDDNLIWNKPIHENIIAKNIATHKIVLEDSIKIDHLIDFDHSMKSSMRNISYLIKEYNQDKENCDPRTIAYLGRMLHGIEEYDKALYFLQKHIQKSGWDEDRYSSWCSMADIYLKKKEYSNAIAAAFEGIQERPTYPDAYIKLHDIYFEKGEWDKAVDFGEMGLCKPEPKTFILRDPTATGWRPTLSMAFCYFKLGDFQKALKLFNIAKKVVPNLPFIKENEKLFQQGYDHNEYMKRFLWMVKFVEATGEHEKVRNLLNSVPNELQEHELLWNLKQVFFENKRWGKNSIVIWAGGTYDMWSPDSTGSGIGGSEEAIIYLSKQFVKLGYEVTVYNNCGDKEGNYDGVEYLNYYKFNPADDFNIIISWRTNIFANNIQGRRKLIWVHDLPNNIHFDEDTVKTFDKIIVLSQYHRSLLPDVVPDDKIYVSSNGIVPEDFIGLEEVERKKHRVIYASSYNRGLEIILDGWGRVRKEVPDAELHIFYGWNVYDNYVKNGYIKDAGFKDRMVEKMRQPGIFEHGRIGHKQLLKEYAKSDIYAYPTTYSGEINCIAYTKAVACGCTPVTNDAYVLGERNPNAVKTEQFIDELIRVLKLEKRHTIDHNYIHNNSWEAIATAWENELFADEGVKTIARDRIKWIRENCKKTDKIIDIGSAEGHLFEGWNRDNIVCLDRDKHEMPNFVKGRAEDLSFGENSFDVAVLGEILEHVENPIVVIKEAMRVAKKVIITVPYEYEWRTMNKPFWGIRDREKNWGKTREQILEEEGKIPLKQFDSSDNYEHLWHKRFYTPDLLKKDLEKAGAKSFEITKLRYSSLCALGAIIHVV